MHSDHSATYLGKVNGAGHVDLGDSRSVKLPPRPATERAPYISREDPFGLTIIVGGTNVRICISTPDELDPRKDGIKWQAMGVELHEALKSRGMEFQKSHDIMYPYLAKMCLDHIIKQFDPTLGPPPLDRIKAICFSVAGLVSNKNLNARVTTSNTGVEFVDEPIAERMLCALQNEIQRRNELHPECAPIPALNVHEKNVRVLNDAKAGLLGEIYYGKDLYGDLTDKNVASPIIGTGLGGETIIPAQEKSETEADDLNIVERARALNGGAALKKHRLTLNEFGHRVQKNLEKDKFICYANGELAQFIGTDGRFKTLDPHLQYAENLFAGPWLAINFVRSIVEDNVKSALAKRVQHLFRDKDAHGKTGKDEYAKALIALHNLGTMQWEDRTKWGVSSNASLVLEINKLILNPEILDRRIQLDLKTISNSMTPDDRLIEKAYFQFLRYFHDLGLVWEAVYHTAKEHGHPLHRIIIAGGIGEQCNKFPERARTFALDLMTTGRRIPPGTIDFSRLSAEARECALTRKLVIEAKDVEQNAPANIADGESVVVH
jgi:hypothetical protein